jgi:tRNA pseudouridine-54 N-methylase
MFRAPSVHLQEETVVCMQHMVLSLSMRVRGDLSVHSLMCTDRPPRTVTVPYAACILLYPPEDEHLRLETCKGI